MTDYAYTAAGVRLAAPDDRERFEQMLERNDRRLRRFAAGIVADRNRLDDVLQEAYLKAYRRLPRQFDSAAHESAWLYRVVYHCCLDDVRRRRFHVELPEIAARGDDADGRLALDRALRRLKPIDRAVIYLVGVAGLDHEHAARVLGVPRGTVSSRLSVARRRFRDALANEGIVDA